MAVSIGWGVGVVLVCGAAQGQVLGTVAGTVTDPSGATVAGARVKVQSLAQPDLKMLAVSDRVGHFSFDGVGGKYVLVVQAEGFAETTTEPFTVLETRVTTVDVKLRIEEQMQQVEVSDQNTMDTDPNQNGDQITLKGKDIDQLPLQSSDLLQELQGLAGGNSPEIYLNGFSGGSLPPRDTIREIRINQNPYSAQNDTNPVNGRIDVFTKPGSAKLHGTVALFGNTAGLNARNPFITTQPSYYSDGMFAYVEGPLGKGTGFSLNGNLNNEQANTGVAAQVLDANLNPIQLTQGVAAPSTNFWFQARVDKSVGTKSTALAQYSVYHNTQTNGGVGQLSLAEEGYNSGMTVQTLQMSNSQIVSAKIVNDTRFQYQRNRTQQTPDSYLPTVIVNGSFNGGGNGGSRYNDNQDRYELQNYVSAALKTHYFNFGGRLRATRDANQSRANYNGQYVFTDINSYRATLAGQQAGLSAAQIAASGGGALQYSQTAGTPSVAVSVIDGALYFQDDWKLRRNVTLSPGLRYETQTQIGDHADFAPRVGIAYSFAAGKDKPPKYVLRGGVGVFYRRFTSGYVLQAARQNGVTQQQYVVDAPAFYTPGAAQSTATLLALGTQSSSTVYQVSPEFRAPYLLASTASLQRQVGTHGSVTLTYLESLGVHDQLTRNINAPLPGTFNLAVPGSGVRPLGGSGNVYEYESGGVDRNHRLNVNSNLHFGDRVYLFQNYALQYVRSNTNGGFPSNQYDLGQDYGRAGNDLRNTLSFGGNAQLPYDFHVFGYLRVTSGSPFNITLGQDLNGDTQFNDRPAFATDLSRPSVVHTAYGDLDTAPMAGQTIIPVNYGKGPGYAALNVDVGKSFSFGPVLKAPAGAPPQKLKPGEKPHIDHRYVLEFTVEADNALNHVNYALPVGTLNSPLFGKPTGIVYGNGPSNRSVNLQTYFHF